MENEYYNAECCDYGEWRKILEAELPLARKFEIHCWSDEPECIELALQFGKIKDSLWGGGSVIEGKVTPQFAAWLLNLPKPLDTEIYNKMTAFFSIFLDSGFSSEHYGTELYKQQSRV